MLEAGKPGWIVFVDAIGHDPDDRSGADFSPWSNQELGVICRINNGFGSEGTIPHSSQYAAFAQRCANYVRASAGCKIWIIGNEMNHAVERPPATATRAAPPANTPAPTTPSSESAASRAASNPVRMAWDATVALARDAWTTLRGIFSRNQAETGASAAAEPLHSPFAGPSFVRRRDQPDDPFHHGDPQRFNVYHQQVGDGDREISEFGSARSLGAGEVITPDLYVDCYRRCRDAIHGVLGHEDDLVLMGAVAPWNNQTQYPENPLGDWVLYFQQILERLGPDGCDGIALHTYTHAADPNLIRSDAKMNPPFQNRHFEFRAYQDFMHAIPTDMRHLPVYITETDQDVPWLDQNIGWVQQAYGEIDYWNRQPGHQQIRSLVLYRWPRFDKWYIEGKNGVINDLRMALDFDYQWCESPDAPLSLQTDDRVRTLEPVNLRRTPGFRNKPGDDVVATMQPDTTMTVLSAASVCIDDLVWWNLRTANAGENTHTGWMAQVAPNGTRLIEAAAGNGNGENGNGQPPDPEDELQVGGRGRTLVWVNMRRTPGFANQPSDDVITALPPDRIVSITNGPQAADGLRWWGIRATDNGQTLDGWMAEEAPNGVRLLEAVADDGKRVDSEATDDTANGVRTDNADAGAGSSDVDTTGAIDTFAPGDAARTLVATRLRQTPGYQNKPPADVIDTLTADRIVTILGGPQLRDGLIWWQVETAQDNPPLRGWMAEEAPNGVRLLEPTTAPPSSNGDDEDADGGAENGGGRGMDDRFAIGDYARTLQTVRLRRTPGMQDKPAGDVLGDVRPETVVQIVDGPQTVDGLIWWQVDAPLNDEQTRGWMAQTAPSGVELLEPTDAPQPPRFAPGDWVTTLDFVRLRRTPGFFDKPDDDVIATIWQGTTGTVVEGPMAADGLTWWLVDTRTADDQLVRGWMAEETPDGVQLLRLATDDEIPPPEPDTRFVPGELVEVQWNLRVRRTPGTVDKPSDDVLGVFYPETIVNLITGPRERDGLTWWQVGGITPDGEAVGWVAERINDTPLLARVDQLPGTDIPNRAANRYLHPPTERPFGIAQLWGENPEFYRQFAYGGVPLLGHNGIDFLTPVGTNLLAVDRGDVLFAGFDASGFGHYVLLRHEWGQSIYAHMDALAVRTGQRVARGESLGASGNTGASTGPHLHFAIRINPFNVADGWGGFSDPLPYLPPEFVLLPPWVLPATTRSLQAFRRLAPSPVTVDMPQ